MNGPGGAADGAGDDTHGTLDPTVLEGLDGDLWARVLPHLRGALHDLDDTVVDPAVRRLRAAPTSRLATGRARRELCLLVQRDDRVRRAVETRLEATDLPDALRVTLAGGAGASGPGPAAPSAGAGGGGDARRLRARALEATRRADRAGARLREVREERDRARRRLEGAEARAEQAERDALAGRSRVEALEAELGELQERLAVAEEERQRAVERERRRGRGEVERLREEIRGLRRDDELRRAELQRLRAPRRTPEEAPPPGDGTEADRVRPARPTRLPGTVTRGTAEEADLLLTPGRLVAVDGYNVTLQHRPQLDLAGQRDWLVRRLATLAAQRRVRPVVVFDGELASAGRPRTGAREVEVRFTPAGLTADDELLFLVEALPEDEPVLAVTDDRELAGRLAALGVDVVGTGPFLWATPG